ncbi:MAG TPA: nuclear transport factor 2 family protein [Caulobacteraceae bacterium]|jgi:ketosteroid isomerase-like protein|nr:nuclear transport factor 2 family protein [Caulobacteraceae bacterium]
MDAAETAILTRRKLTNRLIAEHRAARLRPFFADDASVMVGGGAALLGADTVVAAFDAQFRDAAFVTYERTPQTVEVAADGQTAAEAGRWTGRWLGRPDMTGRYLAAWTKVRGQWVIAQELYVTLAG